jgi:hypothetical protein
MELFLEDRDLILNAGGYRTCGIKTQRRAGVNSITHFAGAMTTRCIPLRIVSKQCPSVTCDVVTTFTQNFLRVFKMYYSHLVCNFISN